MTREAVVDALRSMIGLPMPYRTRVHLELAINSAEAGRMAMADASLARARDVILDDHPGCYTALYEELAKCSGLARQVR